MFNLYEKIITVDGCPIEYSKKSLKQVKHCKSRVLGIMHLN